MGQYSTSADTSTMGLPRTGPVNWLLFCFVLLQNIIRGHLLSMISESGSYTLVEGEVLVLTCDFRAERYNLFDYPVLWKKTQHHEEFQINIMGNLNQPFVGTKRFEVAFTENPPSRRLELIIRDVSQEDSGNYTCEVRGPQSTVVTSVMHEVYVTAPIQSLTMTAGNYSGDPNLQHDEPVRHSRKTTMIENTLNSLRCTAHGGYPAPELTVRLEKNNKGRDRFDKRNDITPQFHRTSRPHLSGRPGLRVITYTTELWTDSFIPTSDDDNKRLKCVASVAGLRTNTTALKLDVHYAPKLKCHNLDVVAWDRNPVLRCEVWFKPELTNLAWILDANGTSITKEDTSYNEFWILNTDYSETKMESQLFMSQAKPENFRKYTIVAENNVAASTKEVELVEKFRLPPTTPQALEAGKPTFNTFVAIDSAYSLHAHSRLVLWIKLVVVTLVWVLCDHR